MFLFLVKGLRGTFCFSCSLFLPSWLCWPAQLLILSIGPSTMATMVVVMATPTPMVLITTVKLLVSILDYLTP